MTITRPGPDARLDPNGLVQLTGEATDPDGKSPIALRWVLRRSDAADLTLGTATANNGETTVQPWKPRDHLTFRCGGNEGTIVLEATDPDGQTGSASVDAVVAYPPC